MHMAPYGVRIWHKGSSPLSRTKDLTQRELTPLEDEDISGIAVQAINQHLARLLEIDKRDIFYPVTP